MEEDVTAVNEIETQGNSFGSYPYWLGRPILENYCFSYRCWLLLTAFHPLPLELFRFTTLISNVFLVFLIVPVPPSGQCAVYYRDNSIDEGANRGHDAVLAIFVNMALSTRSRVVHVWVLSTWEAEAEGNRVWCQPALRTEAFYMPFFTALGTVLSVTSPHPWHIPSCFYPSILRFSHLENISDNASLISLLPEFEIRSVKSMIDWSRQWVSLSRNN